MTDTAVPTYSPAERDRRWNPARGFIDQEGFDAMIVFGEHEDSGPATYTYDTWFTNDRPGSTIVFPRSAEPINLVPFAPFLIAHLDASRKGDTMWITPENIRLADDPLESAGLRIPGLEEIGTTQRGSVAARYQPVQIVHGSFSASYSA
jgi:hypothetical protein